jgi:hypothetical protein
MVHRLQQFACGRSVRSDLKFLPYNIEKLMRAGDWRKGTLWLYFNYHAQIDPDLVYRVFWGTRLRA